jgi:hypothetical protein
MIVYLSIGNSDDKLPQAQWSEFVHEIRTWVAERATTVHGMWFSANADAWQNACWCLEFDDDTENYQLAREAAIKIRAHYRQDSIAWAIAETEFI